MLRLLVVACALACARAVAESDLDNVAFAQQPEELHHIDKRQVTAGLSLGGGPNGESILLIDGIEVVDLNSQIGVRSGSIEVQPSFEISYDPVSEIVIVTNGSTSIDTLDEIEEFLHVSGTLSPLSLRDDLTVSAPNGGELYFDADSVFFTDQAFINDLVDVNRPFFPPVREPIIDVDFNLIQRGIGDDAELVLNADPEGENDIVSPNDDVIEVTGAQRVSIGPRESFEFLQGTLVIRRGSTVVDVIPNLEEFTTYTRMVINGVSQLVLQRFSSADRSGTFRGPGQLLVGSNAGLSTAYFTDQPDNIEYINTEAVSEQLRFSGDPTTQTATAFSTFPPSEPEVDLIEFIGSQMIDLSEAREINFDGNTFTATGDGGQLISIGELNGFSGYVNNEVITGTTTQPVQVQGGTAYYNPSSGRVFFHEPNMVISDGIANAIQEARAPPPQQVRFGVSSTSIGEAVLTGNGEPLVSVTSGANFPIQPEHSIRYVSGRLEVFEADDPGTVINMFDDISQFSTNVNPFSLQTFNGSAPQTFSGPGRLYVDTEGMAFFTTDPDLPGEIEQIISTLPSPRVTYPYEVVEPGVVSVNVSVGGTPVVEVTNSTVIPVGSDQVVLYSDDVVNVADAVTVPDGAPVFFNRSNNLLYYFSDGQPVMFDATTFSLFDGDQIIDGGSFPLERTRVGTGGTVYTDGQGSTLYSPTDTVTPTLVSAVNSLGNIETTIPTDTLTFFDGQILETFTGFAPLLPGGGNIYTTPSQTFYTTSTELNQDIPRRVSEIVTTTVPFNRTTGMSTIITNGENIFEFNHGRTLVQSRFGPTVSIRYVNGTIDAPTVSSEVLEVDRLVYFNGVQRLVFGPDDDITVTGIDGFLLFDNFTKEAFITPSLTIATTIQQAIRNIMRTFRAPVISRPTQLVVTSKFREVDAQFGQTIEVYNGANIDIECPVSSATPPAMLLFFQRFTTMDNQTFDVEIDPTNDTMFSIIGNTLRIMNITDSGVYGCRAENSVGSDTVRSTVTVRPPVCPNIVDNFIPFSPRRGQAIFTAQDLDAGQTGCQIAVSPNDPRIVNIAVTSFDELIVACKGEGRPKARITWFVSIADDPERMITNNDAEFTITEPREGRSYINTTVVEGCATYRCVAENNAGSRTGGVEVCASTYTCTATFGMCSVTCGVGFQQEMFSDCMRMTGAVVEDVELDEVPDGALPEPIIRLCVGDEPLCPVVTYELMTSNFSDCSVTCGCGTQTRNATCWRVETLNGVELNATETDLIDCIRELPPDQQLPVLRQDCNDFPCPFWLRGETGPPDEMCPNCLNDTCPTCESQCDFRHSTACLTCMSELCPICVPVCLGCVENCRREVRCVVQVGVDTNRTLVGDHFVNISGLPQENCREASDIIGDIDVAYLCEVEVDEQFCNISFRPDEVVQCNPFAVCPFQWRVGGPWGECAEDFCQQRPIFCGSTDRDEPWEFNEALCRKTRPHTVRSCGGGTCSRGRWVSTSFTMCSATCGYGTQSRDVTCQNSTGGIIEDGFCIASLRPDSTRQCIVRNCAGVCSTEPRFCGFLAANRLCKVFTDLSQQCCRSCPLFATPITDPPTMATDPATTMAPTAATLPQP